MRVLVLLAAAWAVFEGTMRLLGRSRSLELPRPVGMFGLLVGSILGLAGVLGTERSGVHPLLVAVLTVLVWALGSLQVVHAVRRSRRQSDSEAHRLYMYLKTREVAESQERRGEDGELDPTEGPFHLG